MDAIDVTHRLTLSGLYDLPLGAGQRFLSSTRTNRLTSGWQYNVIMTLESGRPISVTGASNHLATRPNVNPNVPIGLLTRGEMRYTRTGSLQWFNPAAFVNPPDYTFGNAPRYFSDVRGPGTVNFDMSLFKTTKITESTSLELRFEAQRTRSRRPDHAECLVRRRAAGQPGRSVCQRRSQHSATFGKITASGAYRDVQLAAKFHF